MNLAKLKNIYFIGVGGIGMSSLARYFLNQGFYVGGYDRVKTKLTSALETEGVAIVYQDDVSLIDPSFLNDVDACLIVYTPAVPEDNSILSYFQSTGQAILKRAKVLANICNQSRSLAVAGTHGKTTTASILAHIFNCSDLGCNAFLGGIANNYSSNLIVNNSSDITVVEADEYDRSFLSLHPYMAIVTSMDPDHLDIYGDVEQFNDGFLQFVGQIDPQGTLVYHHSLEKHFSNIDVNRVSYGFQSDSHCRGFNLRVEDSIFTFDISFGDSVYVDFTLSLPGVHNLENALAAISLAISMDINIESIKKAVASYSGVYRRFQYRFKGKNHFYIDDYAHHPTEISAVLAAARLMFPDKKLTCVFQPHLYSRTSDFMQEFANILGKFDEILLLDIYPAREKPMSGVTSKVLLSMIDNANKSLFEKEELLKYLFTKELEVLLTIGAGDIDTLVEPLEKHFNNRYSEELNN